jgi:perosamine synthetase
LIRPSVGEAELEEVRVVLESGWLAQGPKVREFERGVATYLGAKHAVATSSCTTALSLAIESLAIKPRSEIIVPDFTFPATANVVVRAGSTPVLCDVDKSTCGIAPHKAGKAMTEQTSAMIPVHPFGHAYAMDEIAELAAKKGCDVIEDAATAFGTRYKGRTVGSKGRAICLSFHPRKVLTTAEGGCLLTDDDEVYERARAMRSHGQVNRKDGAAEFVYNGLNYRMSDVHAALGVAQLKKIDAIVKSRRRQAKVYDELIGSSLLDAEPPVEEKWAYHTYQSYVIVLGKGLRNTEVIPLMREKFGVETQVGTYCLSLQPSFRTTAKRAGSLNTSRMLYERSLTLPLYESLSAEEQAYIVDSLVSATRD